MNLFDKSYRYPFDYFSKYNLIEKKEIKEVKSLF